MTVYRSQSTYSAASTAFTPGATPQDVFAITGSATTNVQILKMGISTTQTADGSNLWSLARRSTANAAGTHAAPAIAQFDYNNAAPSATVLQYTANPTAGTLAAYVWSGWVYAPTVTTVGAGQLVTEVNFEDLFGEPLTLLSTSDVLAWNFKGNALPGGLSVVAYVIWTESPKT